MSLKSPNKSECVKVIVRCRPMSEKEVAEEHEQIIEISPERGMIELSSVKHDNERKQYTFDAVYDWNSKQIDLYEEIFRPLVESVLEGFNGTIFAYGQTGTGKTFTMEGIRDNPELRGVIPNSFEHIFSHISRSQHQQYLVRSSYLEIYQEEIRDLLAKDQTKRFELKERPDIGIYVKDLSSFVCKSIKEIEHVMTVGNQNRSVGATNMNEHSSRSHAIFMITIEHSSMGVDGENHIRVGKLNLVDLAGSERQGKTGAVGQRQKEAIKINLSLSALGNVISALVDGSTHVPYRDSKLTRLLQDSLGGNAKTVMVANIGPASYNYEETLTTLRYANRAKNIKNRPRVNEDPKDALLREFQSEIERLKDQLDERRKKKTRPINGELTCEDNQMIQNNDSPASSFDQEAIEKLQSKIAAMESKLLCGGKDIIDHTVEQQVELERRRSELAEQKRREIEVKQRLDEEDEKNMEIKETFTSMQQEVEIKRRNLRKIVNKLQFVKTEIRDVQEVNALERRELEQMQNDLMKELKLKYLMINNFIPPEEKNKLLSRVVFDEDEDNWKVLKQSNNNRNNNMIIFECPSSCYGYRYPISDYAKMAATVGSSARFKSENIMDVELEMPERMTRDYNAPVLSPRVRAALDNALKGENDEIEITGTNNDLFKPVGRNRNHLSVDQNQLPSNISHSRPSSTKVFKVASHSKKMVRNLSNRPDTAYYPQARGLIRK